MNGTETTWDSWEPASVSDVNALFSSTRVPWWIAGGHAIELAVGRVIREHSDIDVLLLRRDQLAVQRALPTWEWWAADPPGTLRPWQVGEVLPADIHDIWCRPTPAAPWKIQVMLDESHGADWISRRDDGVRCPLDSLGRISPDGVPYLAPEIGLYYKAGHTRPKDEQDFTAVIPQLGSAQRQWLAAAITHTYQRHPWVERLRSDHSTPQEPQDR